MKYRGYVIEKFYSEKPVPKNIIKEYYQSEKLRIDKMIKFKEAEKSDEDLNETINDFIDEMYN